MSIFNGYSDLLLSKAELERTKGSKRDVDFRKLIVNSPAFIGKIYAMLRHLSLSPQVLIQSKQSIFIFL
jgi:hypothetical protein